MKTILITKDSKNKFREVEITLNEIKSDSGDYYVIKRKSGLVEGALIQQPDIEIHEGKVKRTVKEQALLQYNSLIKKQLDKGYTVIDETTTLTQKELEKLMPTEVTDQNGSKKPMLCKVFDFEDKRNQNKTWYISRKHDGVRCFLYLKEGVIHAASRGGQEYIAATEHIRTNEKLIDLFKNCPDLILDGELYRHGWPLSKISGLCRLDNVTEDHKELKFYCYDIVDESEIFNRRLELLKGLEKLNISCLQIVSHIKVVTDENLSLKEAIMNFHNLYVSEGYEGAVVRDANEVYKCGARDRRMQKIKLFTDAEFKIKGLVEGLRDEDMCFLMETKEGYEFKAKPIGDRALKDWYRANISNIIGLYGTVKYFGFTTTANPVPNLPVFKCIRNNEDR